MFFIIKTGRSYKIGAFHTNLPRPFIHQLGKGGKASGKMQGNGVCRVIAGFKHHAVNKVAKRNFVSGVKTEGGTLGTGHFTCDVHRIAKSSGFDCKKGRHNLCCACH